MRPAWRRRQLPTSARGPGSTARRAVPDTAGYRLWSGVGRAFRRSRAAQRGPTLSTMSRRRTSWAERPAAASPATPADPEQPDPAVPSTGRSRAVDAVGCLVAAALGALFLIPALQDGGHPLPSWRVAVDVACGSLACLALWWRGSPPLGVALSTALLGAFSISATAAGLLALASLAAYRPVRSAVLVAVLWFPTVLVFALYSPTTGPLQVLLLTAPLVLAATLCGMYVR